MRAALVSSVVLFVFAATGSRAEEPCPCPGTEVIKHQPDPDHTMCRAGWPESLSKFARPSITHRYCGGYVGGGCAFRGEPRHADEGTWGWDYCGGHLKHRVFLCWCHCTRFVSGGTYQTDGPVFPREPHLPRICKGSKE